MDTLSPEKRSWNMSRIRSRHTGPEMLLRSMLHRAGFRYRLHNKKLPGCPDLVLRRYMMIIFVHGCFWHRHQDCSNSVMPKTRADFWVAKLEGNVRRDKNNIEKLEADGWKVFVVWECELKNAPMMILERIVDYINEGAADG